jgi:hypothetical protein
MSTIARSTVGAMTLVVSLHADALAVTATQDARRGLVRDDAEENLMGVIGIELRVGYAARAVDGRRAGCRAREDAVKDDVVVVAGDIGAFGRPCAGV